MAKPLRVLIVEDSEDDALSILRELQKGGYLPVYERVDSAEEFCKFLESRCWDLVFSDYHLGQFTGPAALALINETGLDLPFILVSGTIGEENVVSIIQSGARDFIHKDNWARLIPAVDRELREAENRRLRKQEQERLKLQASIMDNMAEGLVVYDERGTILLTNPALDRLYGYAPGELSGRHVSIFNDLSANENAILTDEVNRGVRDHGSWSHELINVRKDGAHILTRAHTSALISGNNRCMISVQEDITDNKRVLGQTEQQLARLSALREIDTAVASLANLDSTIQIILNQAISLLPADAAAVYQLVPHTQTLELKAQRSQKGFSFPQSLKIGEEIAGLAARFASPLIARGQPQGTFEVGFMKPTELVQERLNYLDTLTGRLATAMDNNALFESLQQANAQLIQGLDEIIDCLSILVDNHCHRPTGYSRRLGEATVRLGRCMGIPESEIIHVRRGALLYDIGLCMVPEAILGKTDELSSYEKRLIRHHPVTAYEMIYPNTILRSAIDIPYCHHESWDGSGYPRGLMGDQIPLPARIFSVIEVWNALVSDRPYRPAWAKAKAKKYIKENAGSLFDPGVVETYLRSI